MLFKKSRYQDTPLFTADEQGNPVFPGLRARSIGAATPVIEHEIAVGDRLDPRGHRPLPIAGARRARSADR